MKLCTLFILLTLAVPAAAGTLVTRDGQTLTGDLALTPTGITLTPKSGPPRVFALKDVSEATFAPLSTPESAYPAPRSEKSDRTGGNVFAEYFADRTFEQRQLARYEPAINISFDAKTPPDPAIPARCGVRHTARLTAKYSQDYTFTVETQGPVRLWIDDRLRIDEWKAKGHTKASAVATLNAQKPSTLRLETVGSEHAYAARLHWSAKAVNGGVIPATAFLPPAGATAAPQVTLVSPQDDAHFRNPEQIDLEVRATAPAGKIQSVDLIADGVLIAALTQPPYRFAWRNPPVGQIKLVARATDDRGVSAYAEPIDVGVADAGADRSLPAPWGQQTLGKKERRIPGNASFAASVFTLTKAGGQVTEDDDSPQFVYQPVAGDFQLTARLASLTPTDNTVGALAGLMVRENMGARDRFVAVVTSPQTTTVARRADYWGRSTADPRTDPPTPWLRLARMGNRVRAYTSTDGQTWSALSSDRIELPERCFVGLCAMSRNKDTPAKAAFDHVSLTPGPPALAHATEGVLFRTGTFVAAEINGVKDGTVTYTRGGKRERVSATQVARLVYKPTPSELTEKVPAGQTGALVASGDFVEGDLKEVSYRVTVSNLVLGPRTFNLRTGEVLALYLADAAEAGLPYAITTTDGTVYRSGKLQVTVDAITLEEPAVGLTVVPIKDVAQLRLNPLR
jgi:regulation of enolase protein 1 (concanavalin A-like superfamily)